MELPSHPETEGPGDAGDPRAAGTSLMTWVVVGIVAALVVVMVVLHLSGAVGPAGN